MTLVRRGTARLHAALEADSVLSALAAGACTPREYAAAMRALAGAYAPVDRILLDSRRWCPAGMSPYRPRGLPPHAGPSCPVPAVIESPGAYLGARYVVDGAHFGHRLIARVLSRSPAAPLARADAFWATEFVAREEWRALCESLASLRPRPELADAVRAARAVFRHFARHLAGSPP